MCDFHKNYIRNNKKGKIEKNKKKSAFSKKKKKS